MLATAKTYSKTLVHEMENIYEACFPAIAKMIHTKGGDLECAKDVFHDALLVFWEKKAKNALGDVQNEQAYLYGIAKNIWCKKLKDKRQEMEFSQLNLNDNAFMQQDLHLQKQGNRLRKLLELSGKKCLDLLENIYINPHSLQEVTQKFGFGSVHSTSVQKHKCLEKIREIVKQKKWNYEKVLEGN